MRQGQQHKRPRGRGRKPQNVNRTFESNGPDVKIRGTAATVAEKYLSLARDAQVSGDPVASENYLQHAEHYFRIIAAAQAYAQQQNPSEQPSMMNGHGSNDDDDEDRDPRLASAPSGNFGQGGPRGGQESRPEQSADDGDETGDGRGRRNRGRRGRRPMGGDGSDGPAEAAGGKDSGSAESGGEGSGGTVVVEAG
jgi:hypothetical protein